MQYETKTHKPQIYNTLEYSLAPTPRRTFGSSHFTAILQHIQTHQVIMT